MERYRRFAFCFALFWWTCGGPAFAQEPPIATLEKYRALYPTPMSKAQLSEMLSRTAAEHPGWALLRKDAGNNCPTPSGVMASCDWLVYVPTRWGFDVLEDSDTLARPRATKDGQLAPNDEVVLPWAVAGAPPPPPPPPDPVEPKQPAPVFSPEQIAAAVVAQLAPTLDQVAETHRIVKAGEGIWKRWSARQIGRAHV